MGQVKKTPVILVLLAWLFVGLPWAWGYHAAVEECFEALSIVASGGYRAGQHEVRAQTMLLPLRNPSRNGRDICKNKLDRA